LKAQTAVCFVTIHSKNTERRLGYHRLGECVCACVHACVCACVCVCVCGVGGGFHMNPAAVIWKLCTRIPTWWVRGRRGIYTLRRKPQTKADIMWWTSSTCRSADSHHGHSRCVQCQTFTIIQHRITQMMNSGTAAVQLFFEDGLTLVLFPLYI